MIETECKKIIPASLVLVSPHYFNLTGPNLSITDSFYVDLDILLRTTFFSQKSDGVDDWWWALLLR